jgi:hypothetical protein
MTKKLERLFGFDQLEDSEDIPVVENMTMEETRTAIVNIDDTIDKIDEALPAIRDLMASDRELDDIADLAKQSYQDLSDLGMNVEPRFSGVILQTAGMLLGHAITAKTAKLDKKLKMVQLQLAKAKLDHQIKKDTKDPVEAAIDGQGVVLDRNELLKQILNKKV